MQEITLGNIKLNPYHYGKGHYLLKVISCVSCQDYLYFKTKREVFEGFFRQSEM